MIRFKIMLLGDTFAGSEQLLVDFECDMKQTYHPIEANALQTDVQSYNPDILAKNTSKFLCSLVRVQKALD